MNTRVWITWEHQTRNISMAKLLGCDYFELSSNRHRVIRYLVLSYQTLKILFSLKPTELFFQNPSIVLAAICALYKIFNRNVKVIGDYHNAALEKSFFSPINNFISRTIDLTIVSNSNLVARVDEMKGKAFVMPDPIPNNNYPSRNPTELRDNKYIVFICSWASDEPILVVLNAFIESKSFATSDVQLYVTGRIKADRLEKPLDYYINEGINFLGFVEESIYWHLISHSICNIDLTTREDCLVCGAYESIAVGNTVILSNNYASRAYFGAHCVYTDNTTNDLKEKINDIVISEQHYKEISKSAKIIFIQADKQKKEALDHILKLY